MYILVVEDEQPVREVVRLVAEGAFPHASILGAASGIEALNACDRKFPDLLLLDLGLPDMSGFDVLRRLQRAGFAGRTVIITAEANAENRRRATVLGVDGLLAKPFHASALILLMREVLARTPAAAPELSLTV